MRAALLAGTLAALVAGPACAQTFSGSPLAGIPLYGPGGVVPRGKCFAGTATTTSTGAWTLSYAAAGFTSAPTVQAQAVSTGATAATEYEAYPTAPTATGVSGAAASGNTVVVGGSTVTQAGAGVVINVIACGN